MTRPHLARPWSAQDVPDQTGRVALVTGANSGTGYEAARVLARLLATPGSRVVTVSSGAHRMGRIRFDDLHFERGYRPWLAYGQSKLANLLFTYELQRRLEGAKTGTAALAAHPGWARTNLQRHRSWTDRGVVPSLLGPFLRQTQDQGALPVLRAAVDGDARGGDFFGPSGWLELVGPPVRVHSSRRSHDPETQQRLWTVSEQASGVTYTL